MLLDTTLLQKNGDLKVKNIKLLSILFGLTLQAGAQTLEVPATTSVDQNSKFTISGISSGGFLAAQMGVIYSDKISGIGTVAGGFYFCAQNHLQDKIQASQADREGTRALFRLDPKNPIYQAVNVCMGSPREAEMTFNVVADNFKAGLIANPENIKSQKVFVYQGTQDRVVKFQMQSKLEEFYTKLGVLPDNLELVEHPRGAHNFPTDQPHNQPCITQGVPYVASCNYNAAGAILAHLLNDTTLVREKSDSLYVVTQTPTTANAPERPSSVATYGYLAASQKCLDNPSSCHLHVALHGCEMSDSFDDAFDRNYSREAAAGLVYMRTKKQLLPLSQLSYIEQKKNNYGLKKFAFTAGYMDYVEKNNLMVLFPQTWITADNYPYNPKGCWDWFGWTGRDYATNKGKEASWLMNWIQEVKTSPKSFITKKAELRER